MKITAIKTTLKTLLATAILATPLTATAGFDMGAIQSQQDSAIQMQDRMEQMSNNMARLQTMQDNMQTMTDQASTMQNVQEKMQMHTDAKTQTMTQTIDQVQAKLSKGEVSNETVEEETETTTVPVVETQEPVQTEEAVNSNPAE